MKQRFTPYEQQLLHIIKGLKTGVELNEDKFQMLGKMRRTLNRVLERKFTKHGYKFTQIEKPDGNKFYKVVVSVKKAE